jgi:hypothetical protein
LIMLMWSPLWHRTCGRPYDGMSEDHDERA